MILHRSLVKKALLSSYGEQSPQMLQFGITPYKVPVKTAAAKTVGAAKASATRKASGKGKKPKLTVTATTTRREHHVWRRAEHEQRTRGGDQADRVVAGTS